MRIVVKRLTLIALSVLFAVCAAFTVAALTKDVARADDPAVINLTLNDLGINGHNDKAGVYGITRVTALRFSDDQNSSNTGVFSGSSDGVYDWDNLVANTTYIGKSNTFMYAPANVTWSSGYKSSTFNFIYFCTLNQPETGDIVKINAGAYFTMTGTQVYPTSGTCNDKYVISYDINLEFDGAAWVEILIYNDKEVTFDKINSTWNNSSYDLQGYTKYSLFEFTGGVCSGHQNQNMDVSNLIANTVYSGSDNSWNFISSSLIYGPNKKNNNMIVFRTLQSPENGDRLTVNAGAWFITGGSLREKYILTNGFELEFDGEKWVNVTVTIYYTVTFDGNGGSSVSSSEVLENSPVAEPENPTKAGTADEYYSFEYWYLDDENTPYDFSTAVTENITLTAKWTVNEREVIDITFNKVNSTWNNYEYDLLGYTRYNIFEFTGGISSGHHGQGMDVSDLVANTTYTGSEVSWGYISSSLIVGPNVENNNMIVLRMSENPTTGDTITVNAGAWYIAGGADTNKYVLTEEISLRFDGNGWGEIKPFALDGILWNGADLSGKNGAQLTAWGIENNGADAALPLSGTCALLKVGTFYALPTDNLAASVTGIEYDGAPINEIEGAVVAEWLGHLFIYVPNRSGLITIKEGAFILNDYADKDYYFILTEHSTVAVWTEAYEPENIDGEWIDLYGKQRVAFAGVNYQHNNARNYGSGESRLVQTILVFDYTEENKPEADENGNLPVLMLGQASNSAQSAAASRITVNGVKLSEIPGATVDYSQGFNYVYIAMPESAVLPTAEYPNAKLVIKANTVFEDSVLPEVTLTLLGGIWVDTDAESVELSPDGYKTVSDLTGSGKITVAEYDTVMNPIDFDGNLDFRFIISPASLVNDGIPNVYLELCLLSTQEQNWDGFRFDFKYDFTKTSYVIDVYDASYISMEEIENGGTGLKLLATIPIGLAAKDYSAFVIKITENDGVYSITVVENGLKLAEVTDIAPRGDRIGSSTLLYALNTSWILADYKSGDVAVPYVYSLTKEVYFLEEGDSVPEFEYRVYDRTDAAEDVTCEVIVDNDAIEDGKMKAGEWTFLIRATDLNGNSFEREIKLFVSGEQKFTVTFDGKNAAEYAYGSLIAEPQNPEKAGNKKVYYVFDGWYNGEEKWDFANDTVEADLNLVAKYEEKDVLYRITFTGGVEEDITVYAKYGAQLDLSFLDKEGFVTAFTVGGKNATMIQVTEDVTVRVSYEIEKVVEEESEEESVKSGCFSGISGGSAVIALTLLAALVILKKKENKNEE